MSLLANLSFSLTIRLLIVRIGRFAAGLSSRNSPHSLPVCHDTVSSMFAAPASASFARPEAGHLTSPVELSCAMPTAFQPERPRDLNRKISSPGVQKEVDRARLCPYGRSNLRPKSTRWRGNAWFNGCVCERWLWRQYLRSRRLDRTRE